MGGYCATKGGAMVVLWWFHSGSMVVLWWFYGGSIVAPMLITA